MRSSTSGSSCKGNASKSNDGVCDVVGKLQNMSTADTCANCGKVEKENNKLKACTACKLVKYCNRECQIAHRHKHKKECRKRVAELHDEKLFKQPPSLEEDCPICFIRLPYLDTGWQYQSCCGKQICNGCINAPLYDNQGNEVDNQKCAFCRVPFPDSDEEIAEREKKRVELNDPIAIYHKGVYYRDGIYGFPQDYVKALELFQRAAELGNAKAYCNIGYAYQLGHGVKVDKKKATHYYELAAMGGEATARYNLGSEEVKAGNMDRALKHYMIAIRSGYSKSLESIKSLYSNGRATKDDYTIALQLYQAYVTEIKSDQRDKAAAANDLDHYH